MTYQRGTDLGNCLRDCRHLVGNMVGALSDRPFAHCSAAPADTCPREQAEQQADKRCHTCASGLSVACLNTPNGYICGEWKERTSD